MTVLAGESQREAACSRFKHLQVPFKWLRSKVELPHNMANRVPHAKRARNGARIRHKLLIHVEITEVAISFFEFFRVAERMRGTIRNDSLTIRSDSPCCASDRPRRCLNWTAVYCVQPGRGCRCRYSFAAGRLMTRMLAASYSILRPAFSATIPRSITSVSFAA